MRRATLVTRLTYAATTLLLILAGCADYAGDRGPAEGGVPMDPGTDAGAGVARDAGVAIESDGGPSPTGVPPGESLDLDAAFAGAAMACWDGHDNDGDGVYDCADDACQIQVPSCCVGWSSEHCCASSPVAAAPIADCSGDLSRCAAAAGLVFFGGASPSVETRGGDDAPSLTVNDDAMDTGVAWPDALDPAAGDVTIEAELAVPEVDGLTGVDALGFGVMAASVDAEAQVRVVPAAGVLVSRNRQSMTLLVHGEAVATVDVPEAAGYHRYALTLAADGAVTLTVGEPESPLVTRTFAGGPPPVVRPVVWGRMTNPAEVGPPTRIRRLGVSQLECDMPAALSRSAEPAFPAPGAEPTGWTASASASAPAVVQVGASGSLRMALALARGLYLATQQADGPGFELDSELTDPVLSETDADMAPWGSDGLDHPALLETEGGRLELWFTGIQGGRGTIGRALEADGFDPARVQRVVGPEDHEQITSFDHPAPYAIDGVLHVLVRERWPDDTRIGLWRVDGETPSRVADVVRAHADLFAFDHDEVAGPTAIHAEGVHRVYYAGRRGLRWSIGVAVSDDGVTWHRLDRTALDPAEVGFDALGVRDPSVVVTDGRLDLFYTASDGRRTVVGRASGPPPR